MRLPPDAIIAQEKMRDYLLQWRPENDKSQFLAQAGYTKQHAHRLADDIRGQLLNLEAEFEGTTEYGDMYRIVGSLVGPNGRALRVKSIWMIESATKKTKFITLYAAKGD